MTSSELSLLLYFISIGIMILPVIFKVLDLFKQAKLLSYVSMILSLLCIIASIVIDIKMSGQASLTSMLLFVYMAFYIIIWIIEVILLRKEAVLTGLFVMVIAIARIVASFFQGADKIRKGSLILAVPSFVIALVVLFTNLIRFRRQAAKVGKKIKEIHAMKDEVESIDDIIS